MKTIGIALFIAFAASSAALGADMSAPYNKAPAPTLYDWSGVYVGGHIGGGWQGEEFADPGAGSILYNCCIFISSANNPGGAPNNTGSAFLGGAQAGWMYQLSRLVIGGDVDFSGTDLKNAAVNSFAATGTSFANEAYSVKTNWIATATTVLGLAHDRWMFYSKAGVAFANNNYGLNVSGSDGGIPFGFAATSSQTVAGWTVGAGAKWAISSDWFVNVEYDYLDFGSKTRNLSGTFSATPAAFGGIGPGATFTPSFTQSISEVKVGINYKFQPGFLF
jgi:outer membrane immunogenic protein